MLLCLQLSSFTRASPALAQKASARHTPVHTQNQTPEPLPLDLLTRRVGGDRGGMLRCCNCWAQLAAGYTIASATGQVRAGGARVCVCVCVCVCVVCVCAAAGT
jgi:hypothetical protein